MSRPVREPLGLLPDPRVENRQPRLRPCTSPSRRLTAGVARTDLAQERATRQPAQACRRGRHPGGHAHPSPERDGVGRAGHPAAGPGEPAPALGRADPDRQTRCSSACATRPWSSISGSGPGSPSPMSLSSKNCWIGCATTSADRWLPYRLVSGRSGIRPCAALTRRRRRRSGRRLPGGAAAGPGSGSDRARCFRQRCPAWR